MRINAARTRRLHELLAASRRLLSSHKDSSDLACYRDWASGSDFGTPDGDVHALALALAWLAAWRASDRIHLATWLIETAPPGIAALLRFVQAAPCDERFADCQHDHLYEELLAVDRSEERRRHGVYFTPVEIADYLVRRVDVALRESLGVVDGIADASTEAGELPCIRLLDPACGSGVFLTALVRAIHRRTIENGRDWNEFVAESLLPRLVGWDLLPPAIVAAHLTLVDELRNTGYRFESQQPLRLLLRDALAPPGDEPPASVVVGNPPYSSLSTPRHGWIESLIQSPEQGYMHVDGRPLGEKKHWLHDDYVKFLRLAQWHLEQSGRGVAALVTNHGYLQSASFRGLRASIIRCCGAIEIVDLHGGAKSGSRTLANGRDENVFGIAAGVALGVFICTGGDKDRCRIAIADLRGPRTEKLRRLADDAVPLRITHSTSPDYRFDDAVTFVPHEYLAAVPLPEAMPVFTSAPVTARDHFLVAFERAELESRVREFIDLAIPDDTIRQRYFFRTRSANHPPGDSRGWNLAEARRILAADPAWRERVIRCQYRPFDERFVLWHEALVDWPRSEVTRHLLSGTNLTLIARRQFPRGETANYFWATRLVALDGIIRSDNRGSESLFPVWLDEGSSRRANFSPAFVVAVEQRVGRRLLLRDEADAVRLAGYIYGLCWSSEYRTRYAEALANGFPRILLPSHEHEFARVSQLGCKLLELHSRKLPGEPASEDRSLQRSIAAGYPRWREGQVWINPATPIAPCSESLWTLRIGSHQVAKKWLKDRRARGLSRADCAAYREVIARLNEPMANEGNYQ
jgi:predicted helicase